MSYTYVMSDIHGHYDEYREMLVKIDFKSDDMLYILGDILDRGPHPIKIILDLMERPNVVCIAGNHCVMACDCFKFLLQEISNDSINKIDDNTIEALLNWQMNGSDSTIKEMHSLSKDKQKEIIDFIQEFEIYEEVFVENKEYLLVHAGLGNFSKDREIWDYDLSELVWTRPDYDQSYFDDKYVITGHTPTLYIESKDNLHPGFIFKANNHIAIDCGCGIPGGRLACLRLEDMQEFYVENH